MKPVARRIRWCSPNLPWDWDLGPQPLSWLMYSNMKIKRAILLRLRTGSNSNWIALITGAHRATTPLEVERSPAGDRLFDRMTRNFRRPLGPSHLRAWLEWSTRC